MMSPKPPRVMRYRAAFAVAAGDDFIAETADELANELCGGVGVAGYPVDVGDAIGRLVQSDFRREFLFAAAEVEVKRTPWRAAFSDDVGRGRSHVAVLAEQPASRRDHPDPTAASLEHVVQHT